MISRSTLSGATRMAIALATARFALNQKTEMTEMIEVICMMSKISKKKMNEKILKMFNKIYYVFLEHTLQKFSDSHLT